VHLRSDADWRVILVRKRVATRKETRAPLCIQTPPSACENQRFSTELDSPIARM